MNSMEPNGEKAHSTRGFRCDLAGRNFDFASTCGARFVACNCCIRRRKYEIPQSLAHRKLVFSQHPCHGVSFTTMALPAARSVVSFGSLRSIGDHLPLNPP